MAFDIKENKLDKLKATDFPGVDPDKFFAWWKEKVILEEEVKSGKGSVHKGQFDAIVMLLNYVRCLPQYLKCRRLQKEAGITKDDLKKALKGV